MSRQCPQDGGFIGDAGCTHPNHEHSKLVKGLLEAKEPREISEAEARSALQEGFYVGRDGARLGFGANMLRHFAEPDRTEADTRRRLELLPFAIDAVKSGTAERNHRGLKGRTAYMKRYAHFGIMAVSDAAGKNIENVFNIVPNRRERLK